MEEIDDGRRRGGRRAGSRSLDAPDIGVLETANVDQTRRPPGLGTRNHRHQTVLADERQSRGRAFAWIFANDNQPPETLPGGKENLFTVGHPSRVVRIQRGRREPLRLARRGQSDAGLSQRKPVKLTSEQAAALRRKTSQLPSGETAGLVSADHRGLRIGQLPFLSGLERNHEQGVRLALARGVRNHQTVAVRTPGKVWRSDPDPAAYADLGQFALRPAQWRDQPQFTLAGFRLTAQEGDPAAVGRPDGVVVVARVSASAAKAVPAPIC